MDVRITAPAGPLHHHRHAGHRGTRADRRGDRGPLATRAAGDAARRLATLAALALLALGLAAESRADEADSAAAFSTDAGWTMPFVQRRVANPRYRLPSLAAPPIGRGATGRLRALDHFRAQVFHHGFRGPGNVTQWELQAGEEYRSNDGFELAVGGGHRLGAPELHALRLAVRHGGWAGSMGDAEPFRAGKTSLHRLRGMVVRYTDPRQGRWFAFGGAPTPTPRTPTPRILLGGLAAEDARWDEAWLSAAAVGFWRGSQPMALPFSAADTLPGRGIAGTLGWRVSAARGWLAGRLGAQVHGLEGRRSLAAQHALEWTLQTRSLVIAVSDDRATRRARMVGTERISSAAQREDRWNVQTRFARGRAETHLTGVIREGGELSLAARTVQLGASGSLGSSPWYTGADAVWDRRALTGSEERRLSVHAGGLLGTGHALLARLESAVREGSPDALTAMAEASLTLLRGVRWTLAPRLGWQGGALQQANATSHLSWALPWSASRLTASLTLGALRDQGFRGGVREAALALSLSPRLRDRGDVEVRRLDLDGRPLWETSVAYDALLERYETPGQGWLASRDTGRVTVRVTRSGNGSGLSDILVSLDGTELRFTDADGRARFDHVTPGVHVVAIEERSLPPHHEIVQMSRTFVIVEPGRAPEPVLFTITRSERRSRF